MTFTKTGGEGIWSEYTNDETGEKSLKTHELKLVKLWCDKSNHVFRVRDMGKRLAVCDKCGQELNLIVGVHKIDEDIVTL
jgi:hypothetical protein